MITRKNLNATAARILHLLTTFCATPSQLQQIQAQLILNNLRSNTTVAHAFITACNSLHLLNSAAFPLYINNLKSPHIFTCNTLLKAFSHSSTPQNCLIVYSHMHRISIQVNHYTFPSVLKALADLRLVKEGTLIHAQIVKVGFLNDVYVGNSLMNLYAAIGQMGLCGKLFDEMPLRDVVSWTVVISGFKDVGRFDEALIALERMRNEGVMPNQVTATNALAACAGLGALEMGVWIHEHVKMCGWDLDVILGTSLIDMYGKCGRMEEALCVFGEMNYKNVCTWNAVLNGLALSKSGKEALQWFYKMEEEGVQPDDVTLLSVLSACVHSVLLHTGRKIFSSLVNGRFGFAPSVKHYGCMIDLLARYGGLEEAFKMIGEMPFEPTVSIWGSLLAGSRAQANMELSEIAAQKLVELEPQNSAYYVVLSNMYAGMGRWKDVEKVRVLMKARGLKKDMGGSAAALGYQEHALALAA